MAYIPIFLPSWGLLGHAVCKARIAPPWRQQGLVLLMRVYCRKVEVERAQRRRPIV